MHVNILDRILHTVRLTPEREHRLRAALIGILPGPNPTSFSEVVVIVQRRKRRRRALRVNRPLPQPNEVLPIPESQVGRNRLRTRRGVIEEGPEPQVPYDPLDASRVAELVLQDCLVYQLEDDACSRSPIVARADVELVRVAPARPDVRVPRPSDFRQGAALPSKRWPSALPERHCLPVYRTPWPKASTVSVDGLSPPEVQRGLHCSARAGQRRTEGPLYSLHKA